MDTPTKKSPSILDLASGMVAEELAVLRKYLNQSSANQARTTCAPIPTRKRPSSLSTKK